MIYLLLSAVYSANDPLLPIIVGQNYDALQEGQKSEVADYVSGNSGCCAIIIENCCPACCRDKLPAVQPAAINEYTTYYNKTRWMVHKGAFSKTSSGLKFIAALSAAAVTALQGAEIKEIQNRESSKETCSANSWVTAENLSIASIVLSITAFVSGSLAATLDSRIQANQVFEA